MTPTKQQPQNMNGQQLAKQDPLARAITVVALIAIGMAYTDDTRRVKIAVCVAVAALVLASVVRYWGQSCFPLC